MLIRSAQEYVPSETRAGRTMIASARDLRTAAASQFFAGLEQDAFHTVVNFSQPRRVEARECVTRQGERATHLYFLSTGQVRFYRATSDGTELLLRWLVPGDVFGLATLLPDPLPYMGTAESMGQCDIWSWQHSSIRGLASRYPLLAENALRIALLYLRDAAERYEGMTTRSAQQRLAEALIQLSYRTGQVFPHGVLVDATNAQLGTLAHVSPSTASHILGGWQQRGVISRQRKKVVLHCPEALLLE